MVSCLWPFFPNHTYFCLVRRGSPVLRICSYIGPQFRIISPSQMCDSFGVSTFLKEGTTLSKIKETLRKRLTFAKQFSRSTGTHQSLGWEPDPKDNLPPGPPGGKGSYALPAGHSWGPSEGLGLLSHLSESKEDPPPATPMDIPPCVLVALQRWTMKKPPFPQCFYSPQTAAPESFSITPGQPKTGVHRYSFILKDLKYHLTVGLLRPQKPCPNQAPAPLHWSRSTLSNPLSMWLSSTWNVLVQTEMCLMGGKKN